MLGTVIADVVIYFSFQGDEVKSKINILKTYYSKELVKARDSKKSSTSGDTYDSKWPHYRSLWFLRDTMKPRNTTSALVSIVCISLGSKEKKVTSTLWEPRNICFLF